MKIAYLDCFSGISGDMTLGAFIDCGVKVADLKKQLAKLKIKGFDLKVRRVKRGHISGTKVDVMVGNKVRFSNLKRVFSLIDKSSLDKEVKQRAKDVYSNLAKAEAAVHREKIDSVHFHQLGDLDTVIDIVGCVICMKLLGIEKMYASSLTLGSGMVRCGKDIFPLPAPATLQLLKKRSVAMDPGLKHETVTPTGAAIIATLTQEVVGSLPMRVIKTGYGAGTYQDPQMPNLLTVIIADVEKKYVHDTVNVVAVNIDDTLPLNFEILFERLFASGALDVYTVPVMMKKMRPGILLHVLAEDGCLDKVLAHIFEETTTLGVRISKVFRRKIERKVLNLKTDYGIIVGVKIGSLGGQIVNIAPEYEDCKKIALRKKLPFKTVYDRVKAQAVKKFL
ncbi:MAG: nickel pincer cofactor biosynthesis protein LarC [PVC group bacterium]|nr:nickel pincer cofactor biosynthesis protein LarC [PVC group bacterium]